MSIVAVGVAIGALALSAGRDADEKACRAIAWGALPAGAALPAGWSMASNRIFVDNLTTTLVGPAPTDTTQQPAVYVSVSCYGSDVELAFRRSHEAELAAGSTDVPFATLGEESFAVSSPGAGSTTLFLRRDVLIASVTAPSTLETPLLLELGQAVDAGLSHVLASGPEGPAVDQPSRAPVSSTASPRGDSPSAPSSAIAESHVAPDLEARLPKAFAGTRLTSQSVTGATALGDDATAQALVSGLAELGKSPADLVIAQAIDPTGSLRLRLDAYRVQDIAASVLDRVLVESLLADPAVGADSSPITISGHRLTKVEYPEAPPTYFLELRDVVYVIQTSDEGVVATIVGLLE